MCNLGNYINFIIDINSTNYFLKNHAQSRRLIWDGESNCIATTETKTWNCNGYNRDSDSCRSAAKPIPGGGFDGEAQRDDNKVYNRQ